jgi:hypothetical protein
MLTDIRPLSLLTHFTKQYCFEILIFVQQPNKFTWVGVVLVLGSLVAIGIEKVKQSQTGSKSSIKHRSSDLPSGGADTTEEERLLTSRGTARTDEETPELMVNGNSQGKAE